LPAADAGARAGRADAQAHARACSAAGHPELAAALRLLDAEATDALPDLLAAVCAPLCAAFFPRRARPSPRRSCFHLQ